MTCWKTWGMNTSVSQACANSSHPLQKELRNTLTDFQMIWNLLIWCARHAHMDAAVHKNEWRKQLMSAGGVAWERKRGGGVLSYSSFGWRTEGQENDEGISCCPLPAIRPFLSSILSFPNFIPFFSPVSLALKVFFVSLHISLFLILAQLCLLMTCVSLAVFPFGFGNGRKPWFLHRLSFSVLTEHWLFMTANSVILCFSASIPVFLSVSHFHTFSTFLKTSLSFLSLPPPLSLTGGLLQLFENRLLCCCWVLESEQDPGLTCGREGEPV